MYEQDLHRAARDAQRHTAARVVSPTRYSDAVNRYLGVHDYVERKARTDTPPAEAEPVTQAEPVVDRRGHTVVVGVDASPASAVAVDHAAIEAELYGWDLCLIHVQTALTDQSAARNVVVGVDGSPDAAVAFGAREAGLRGSDLVLLHAAEDGPDPVPELTFDPGLRVHRRRVDGPAWRALVEASRHAGAVVIGSRGHGGVSGLLVGSVGQRLIRQADCPVFIVR